MELPVSVNTLGALVTLGLGIYGLFWPLGVATFVGIAPEGERGVSEIRATYGGLFLAMGLFAVVMQSTDVFRVVGVAWLGAAGGRCFSVVRDDSRSGANLGAVAMETVIGLSLLIPWDSFFGA